jgi:hypothetical protein
MMRTFLAAFPFDGQKPKFHAVTHYVFFIRLFGSPRNWDTGDFELFHKTAAKAPWRHSNRGEGHVTAMLLHVHLRMVMAQARAIRVENILRITGIWEINGTRARGNGVTTTRGLVDVQPAIKSQVFLYALYSYFKRVCKYELSTI